MSCMRVIISDGKPAAPVKPLSPREQQIYDLRRGGLANKIIQERLGISSPCVSVFVAQIRRKGWTI